MLPVFRVIRPSGDFRMASRSMHEQAIMVKTKRRGVKGFMASVLKGSGQK
jgi:hypothetical protein